MSIHSTDGLGFAAVKAKLKLGNQFVKNVSYPTLIQSK